MRFMLIGIGLGLLLGCTSEKSQPTLSNKEVTDILMDVHTARIAVNTALPDDRDSLINVFKGQISDLHGLTRSELEDILENLNEPAYDPNAVFNRLSDRIEAMKDSLSTNN
jgi:hypothetical protein